MSLPDLHQLYQSFENAVGKVALDQALREKTTDKREEKLQKLANDVWLSTQISEGKTVVNVEKKPIRWKILTFLKHIPGVSLLAGRLPKKENYDFTQAIEKARSSFNAIDSNTLTEEQQNLLSLLNKIIQHVNAKRNTAIEEILPQGKKAESLPEAPAPATSSALPPKPKGFSTTSGRVSQPSDLLQAIRGASQVPGLPSPSGEAPPGRVLPEFKEIPDKERARDALQSVTAKANSSAGITESSTSGIPVSSADSTTSTPSSQPVAVSPSETPASTSTPSNQQMQNLLTRAGEALRESEQIMQKQYEDPSKALSEIAAMQRTVEKLKDELTALQLKEMKELITRLDSTITSLSIKRRENEEKIYARTGYTSLNAPQLPNAKDIDLSHFDLLNKIKTFKKYAKSDSAAKFDPAKFKKFAPELFKCVATQYHPDLDRKKFVNSQNEFDIEKFMTTLKESAKRAKESSTTSICTNSLFPGSEDEKIKFVDSLITHLLNLKANNCQIQEELIGTIHRAESDMKLSNTLGDDEKKNIDLAKIRPLCINLLEDDSNKYCGNYMILFPAVRVYTNLAFPPLVVAPIAIAVD